MSKIISKLMSYFIFLIGYGTVQLISPLIASTIALLFGLFYIQALQADITKHELIIVQITFLISFIIHAIQSGALYKLKLPAWSKHINLLNRNILSDKKVCYIKDGLEKETYIKILEALKKFPQRNTVIALAFLVLNYLLALSYLLFLHPEPRDVSFFLKMSLIYFVAAVIYSMFTNIFITILNRDFITLCKKKLHEKNIYYTDHAYSTLKTKLFFILIICIIGLFISNSIVSLENKKLSFVLLFNGILIVTVIVMITLVFNIIAKSLSQVTDAVFNLKHGGDGLVFISSIDKEVMDLAVGVEDAAIKIKDYQMNLENKVVQRTQELQDVLNKLEAKNQVVEQEFKLAKKIQSGIIPINTYKWNNIYMSSHWQSLMPISGDYFDITKCKNNHLSIIMCDVSGHGIPAALITTMAKISFSTTTQQTNDPAEILFRLNNDLSNAISTSDYLTAYCFTIDSKNKLNYSNAGHPFPLYYNSRENQIEELKLAGHLLGIFSEGVQFVTHTKQLYQGDKVLLFTDGLTESRNAQDVEFETILKQIFLKHINKKQNLLIQSIKEELQSFVQHVPYKDDISFLILEVT